MRKLTMALLGAALMATAACNTIRGAGQDVEAAGEAVQETAKEVQN
jgi:predicted small secreted protein